ncbi:MAG TPA: 2-octaprenyl-6-methoxyphenyl hydroxylase, partial [Cellvibrionaceae bacterium]|nr:2-octaprenyl-6-methoxyphenyl hydroxylase [Cellvibrionaceae bacterium]
MELNSEYPVVVVGAGLVGASLALALRLRLPHLAILLIDQQGPQQPLAPGQMDPRVVALNLASQTLLDQLGVWGGLERLCAYEQMQVWDGEGSGAIEFAARELGQEQLGWIVENGHVLAELHRLIAAAP